MGKRVDLGEPHSYVAGLKPRNLVYEVADRRVVGLRIVVQPSGFKSWAVRYVASGRTRKHTLGPFPRIKLKAAHKLASKALLSVHAGNDPAKEKAEERRRAKSGSVAKAFAEYESDHLTKRRSARETKRIFERHVLPKWRARPLVSITKSDVIELLKAIRAPIMANRTYSALSKFFKWCSAHDFIPAVPTIGVGKLHEEPKSRDRTLTDQEIRWFWQASAKIGFPFGPLFKALLITGCRRSEAAGMTLMELDQVAHLWSLEGQRTKTENAHKIFIAPAFEAILDSIPSNHDFVFGRDRPPSGFSKAKSHVDREMAKLAADDFEQVPLPWRLHDLRRTFRTGLARLGVATEVAERCINHSSGPSFEGVKGIYNVFGYPEEMQAAFEKWSAHVGALVNDQDRPPDL
jgi:integrase